MDAVLYYLLLPWIHLLARLPFGVLYRLSDVMYVLLFRVLAYRNRVIRDNMRRSFPRKSDQEIEELARKFERYFCDLVLESIKTLGISRRNLRKRVIIEGIEVFEQHFKGRQSLVVVLGHFGNWELASARWGLEDLHPLDIVYKPIANPYVDRLVQRMRTRTGNGVIPMKQVLRSMLQNRREVRTTAFLSDQTPATPQAYWTGFLGQDTAIFEGPSKIARKLRYPIVYMAMHRPSRGHYIMKIEELVSDPGSYTHQELTEMHTRRLEKDIQQQPEIWLWSHRRWKHGKPG